jgi:protein TonB
MGNKRLIILFLFFSYSCIAQQNDIIDGQRVLSFLQVMPKFKGDLMKYVADSLQFIAINDEQVQSHVYVSFIIDTTGNVCRPIISQPAIKGKISRVEEAVLKTVRNMPKWTPGYQNGKAVPVRYEIPVTVDFK